MRIQWLFTRLSLIVSLLVVYNAQPGQCQDSEECKAFVRRAYDKFNAYGELPVEGKMCSISYSQFTYMRDSSRYHNSTVSVSMKVSTEKVWYNSDGIELFQDGNYSIVVVDGRKTVYLRDSDFRSPEARDRMMQKLLQSSDSMLATAVIERCVNIDVAGRTLRQVTLKVSEQLQAISGIAKIEYAIDVQDEAIRSVRYDYTARSKIAAVIAEFHSMNYNLDEEPFEGEVYDLFISSDGNLMQPYNTYRLIDVRAKAAK